MNKPNNKPKGDKNPKTAPARTVSRGAAIRAQRRSHDDAHRIVSQYADASEFKEDKQLCSMYSNSPAMNMTSFMNVNNFPNWSYRQSVRQTQQAPAQRLRFRQDPKYLY